MTSTQTAILKTIGNGSIRPGTDGRYILINPQGVDSKFGKNHTPAIQHLIVHGQLERESDVTSRVQFIVKKGKK